VWEAGRYPRHRVCGEFISGGGRSCLAALGLLETLHGAGARSATDAAFFAGPALIAAHSLPQDALCISRFSLDACLALEFQRLGGELRPGAQWTGKFGAGIVRAGGRRAEPVNHGWRLFGLKAHARDVELTADVEMHFVPAGYVGLCRLGSGLVNVCGLFRSLAAVPDLSNRWRDWLRGPPESALHARLAGAKFDDNSFCSVAGLGLRPRRAARWEECCVGDALTMIPPVTGNGMSMAFESAELAVEPLVNFSRGGMTWDQAQREIASRCDNRFGPRLRWASWLQRALFHPSARAILLFLAGRSGRLWRAIFERTR
jgi:flavin-dependent dehydrogenase